MIRSGFESKRRESPRIHNVFAQQYGFANFGRVFTVIRFETLSWGVLLEPGETSTQANERLPSPHGAVLLGRVLVAGTVRANSPVP